MEMIESMYIQISFIDRLESASIKTNPIQSFPSQTSDFHIRVACGSFCSHMSNNMMLAMNEILKELEVNLVSVLKRMTEKLDKLEGGGWWSGIPTLAYDNQFISKVEEKFPKDTDIIVACQKGLRSLAACEQLYVAGYRNLFWIQGGLEAAEEEDLEREGPQPFKLAGIGGMSEFLGWTDQQRAAAAKEGWGYRAVFSARLIGLFLAADALYIGAQQAARYLQDVRGH